MSKIEVQHVNKRLRFAKRYILSDINLTFQENEIYGLFGENGAGKSTLMELIADYNFRTSGSILYDGQDVHENAMALKQIYYMNQLDMYPKYTRVKTIFKMVSNMYANYDINLQKKLIVDFKLDVEQFFNRLSTGYKSIVKVILSLCVPCQFVFLDEPTLGLDARNREIFYQTLIETYSERPRTFVLSTHIVEEIDNIISQFILVENGKIVMHDSVERLQSQSYSISGPAEDINTLLQDVHVLEQEQLGRYKTVHFIGKLPNRPVPDTIDVTHMKLQKLLVYLMDRGIGNEK
jgi:ABC-2 type transport system ATP-binding protein